MLIVGIDPDLEKSGVAVIEHGVQGIRVKTAPFHEIVTHLTSVKEHVKAVYIEAGWLNRRSNWHKASTTSKACKIAKNVGENHAAGKLLAKSLESVGIKVILVRPSNTKLKAEQFQRLTNIKARLNQDQRDAVMLIWGMA